jgi:hypothetical protein
MGTSHPAHSGQKLGDPSGLATSSAVTIVVTVIASSAPSVVVVA